jgi:hypothetical protein
MLNRHLGLALCLGTFSGCAHSFFYAPEIKGTGATLVKEQAIDFAVPPGDQPELKMRLRSMGTEKVRDQKMFVVRLAFARPKENSGAKATAREYLIPADQTIQFGVGNKPQVKPAYIRTKARKDKVIELTGLESESIDLLYPMPPGDEGTKDIERIVFHWTLHYGNNLVENQSTRFDRYDSRPQQAVEPYPNDPDYPYDISPLMMPGWEVDRDPFWWPMIY